MIVKLPCKYSGEKILNAFKAAAVLHENAERKWLPKEFVADVQYEPDPVRQTTRSKGVHVELFVLKKEWGFFGKEVWASVFPSVFTLSPLWPAGFYEEVEVEFKYPSGFAQGVPAAFVTDPQSPYFEDVREAFERILNVFYRFLETEKI